MDTADTGNDLSGKELVDEATPWSNYVNRRQLLKLAVGGTSVAATAGIYRWFNPTRQFMPSTDALAGLVDSGLSRDELLVRGWLVDESMTREQDILTYNNFYEFTTDKVAVAKSAEGFDTTGWTVEVGGMVHTPRKFTITDLKDLAPLEERVYRMRCVEAWSMVIPWNGIPLAALIAAVDPMAEAKYVAFETLLDPERMPGQKTSVLDWPYVEGLTIDEAMHPLAILAMGIYGRELPPQDGAPVRLVVPWKYGFKGIKSIVKITLVSDEPPTTWNLRSPREYGFYANVNPAVAHPRWSQATEQRIGETGRRPTLPFNGYEAQVASLYADMDLAENF